MGIVTIRKRATKETLTIEVLGIDVDYQNRCEHSTSHLDVIAFRYKCCGRFYACGRCHDLLAGHEIDTWDKTEYETKGVLCGVCRAEFTIKEYLGGDDRCPSCGTQFNPDIKASDVPTLLGRRSLER
jgi:uncharacterized CHY-type Zn-finger protein